MSGPRVLITGASSGIGEALAHEYAKRGARVFLVARRAERLEAVADSVRAHGGEARTFVADVTDRAALGRAVSEMEQVWGGIDVAVANAGINSVGKSAIPPLDGVVRVMRTNFEGMVNLFDAVMPAMLERGDGHFVGIASLAGLRGLPSAPGYSASKAAMQSFLEAVRPRLRRRGVAVTTVNPGFIRSEMTAERKFPMPFLMDTPAAAKLMVRRLDARPAVLEFPLPMKVIVRLMRLVPNAIYDKVWR